MDANKTIAVQAHLQAPVERVWQLYTIPEHIVKWNHASDDWHSPHAENDLKFGGRFNYRMEAKDGSAGFDFWGIYDRIEENKLIEYTMGDGRRATITFTKNRNETGVEINFEAEQENSPEMQRTGWQAILDNFKKYVEENA